MWANHPTGKNPQAPTHMAWGNSIALDKNNNPYITGYYNGPARFNTMVLDSIAGFFVSKLNTTDGQFQWALGQSSSFSDMPEGTWGTSIVVDNDDNCFVGGKWGDFAPGSITFGPNTYSKTHTNAEAFITKISSNGSYEWGKSISTQGDPSRSVTQALALDNAGNLFATGRFLRTAYFDSFSFTSFEMNGVPWVDIFIGKIGDFVSIMESNLDKKNYLLHNYPNPFNPETTIVFNLPESQTVELKVYNSKGEIVQNLINSKLNAGIHTINFDGRDLNSGVYFYRLQTENKQIVDKMILVK